MFFLGSNISISFHILLTRKHPSENEKVLKLYVKIKNNWHVLAVLRSYVYIDSQKKNFRKSY